MRILHIMLRVGNLDESINFYTQVLGMELLKRDDYPEGRFTLAFLGYTGTEKSAVLELTHNWDVSKYDLGSGFGHLALECEDIQGLCTRVKDFGGIVNREPAPMKFGTTVIAFISDPDGYKIELVAQ